MQHITMRRAIGFLIVLWGLSQVFSSSISALDDAASESFRAIEAAAILSQTQLEERI